MPTNPDTMTCIGAIMGPHGVRGLVKVKALLETPADFGGLGPVHFGAQGEPVPIVTASVHKQDVLIVRLDGIADRDTAAALKGTKLYVPEDRLGAPADDEVFMSDLEGLTVLDEAGETLGAVAAVSNYGASDVLEIQLEGKEKIMMLPFIEDAVPSIDLEARCIVIDPAFLA